MSPSPSRTPNPQGAPPRRVTQMYSPGPMLCVRVLDHTVHSIKSAPAHTHTHTHRHTLTHTYTHTHACTYTQGNEKTVAESRTREAAVYMSPSSLNLKSEDETPPPWDETPPPGGIPPPWGETPPPRDVMALGRAHQTPMKCCVLVDRGWL